MNEDRLLEMEPSEPLDLRGLITLENETLEVSVLGLLVEGTLVEVKARGWCLLVEDKAVRYLGRA